MHVCVMWPTREGRIAPRGDIQMVLEPGTDMARNRQFDESLLAYGEGYENSLGFSEFFQGYIQGFARDLVARHHLVGKHVIEVGCGDGEFLELMVAEGAASGVGFDPSYPPGLPTERAEGRIQIHREAFPPAGGPWHGDADLLVCRQVLEHVPDPLGFLQTIRRGLPAGRPTAVAFEVPNLLPTLEEQTSWDIIYEHCTYFTVGSLARLLAQAGFRVTSAHETYERQFITVEATTDERVADRSAEMDDHDGLHAAAHHFDEAWNKRLADWQARLAQYRDAGRSVAIWGTGARGINFLNLVDRERVITAAIDINPRKHGLFAAGTGQCITPPDSLRELRPDVVIIMNGIYENEIRASLAEMGLHPEIRIA
ncbi:MAG: class I SAM-dependent methyltransferase [Planctomycetota bacterium]